MSNPINLRKFGKSVEIEISFHLTKEIRFRKWLAVRLIRLAALVLGCGIKFVDE